MSMYSPKGVNDPTNPSNEGGSLDIHKATGRLTKPKSGLTLRRHKYTTFLQHSIKRTVRETGLYLNADKTEFIYFNQDASEGMKSLNSEKIKQVEEF